MILYELALMIQRESGSDLKISDIESIISTFLKVIDNDKTDIHGLKGIANFRSKSQEEIASNTVEDAVAYYRLAFKNHSSPHKQMPTKNEILHRVQTISSSMDLFGKLPKVSGLSIKYLADEVFEITPKTFSRYKNEPRRIPALLKEQAIKIIDLYTLGNDLFGSNKAFNAWLSDTHVLMGNRRPIEYLNTSTGIDLLLEELKRIEFGATA